MLGRPAAAGGAGEGVRVVVLSTAGVAVVSALVPVVNLELLLLAAAATTTSPGWALALAAAAGQMVGKTGFYLLGRGVLDLARYRRRHERELSRHGAGRWAGLVERASLWARRRPWGPAALNGVSALGGIPPFAVVCVLSGTLRMRWWTFAATGFAGRALRFWAVVSVPGALPWLEGLPG